MTAIRDYPNDSLQFLEGDAPGTPASGRVRLYAKADGKMYSKDDTGVEAALGGGSSGSEVLTVSTPNNTAGTVTLNFAGKSKYVGAITLGANVTTLAFSNLPGAGKYAE